MDLKSTLRNLVAVRREKNITQEELGQRTGLSQASIAKIENSSSDPTWKQVVRIARALGYDLTSTLEPLEARVSMVRSETVFSYQESIGATSKRARAPRLFTDMPDLLPIGRVDGLATTLAIRGLVGVGKTVALAAIVKELHNQANVVVVDPRSEIIRLLQMMRAEALFNLSVSEAFGARLPGDTGVILLGEEAASLDAAKRACSRFPDNGRPNILLCDEAPPRAEQSSIGDVLQACPALDGVVYTSTALEDVGADMEVVLDPRRGGVHSSTMEVTLKRRVEARGATYFEAAGPAKEGPSNVRIDLGTELNAASARNAAISLLRAAGLPVYVFEGAAGLSDRIAKLQGPAGVVIDDPTGFYDEREVELVVRTARSRNLSIAVLKEAPGKPHDYLWSGAVEQH